MSSVRSRRNGWRSRTAWGLHPGSLHRETTAGLRTTRFNRIFNQHQPSAALEHGGSLGREMHERGFQTVSTRSTADESRTQSCYKGLAMKEDVADEHGELLHSINRLLLDD